MPYIVLILLQWVTYVPTYLGGKDRGRRGDEEGGGREMGDEGGRRERV